MGSLALQAILQSVADGDTHGCSSSFVAAMRQEAAALGYRPASGMSAFGQDPKGLEAKPASPAPEGGDAL